MADDTSYRVPRTTDQPLPQHRACVAFFRTLFFRHLVDINVWIAGGALRDWFESRKLTDSDVDFFSSSRTELCKALKVFRNQFSFRPYAVNKRVIKGWCTIDGKKVKVDIVKVLFDDPTSCIDSFDFTVCCWAVDRNQVYYHPSAPFDLLQKRLVINTLPFPVSTFQRMQKYLKRGYWICNGGMLEIAKAMSEVNFNDADQNIIELYPDGSPRFVRYD